MKTQMIKTASHRLVAACLVAAVITASGSDARAQSSPPAPVTVEDSIALLEGTILRRTADRDQLGRMLAALNVVDSVYKPLYPAWLVLDDDLRERINRAFRQRHPQVSRDTDVVVVASPEGSQILDLSVGSVNLGRLESRQTLSDSLDKEILHGMYQRKAVDLRVEPPRTDALKNEPQYASLAASAFGLRLMFSRGLGLEAAIGREEIGYHFWSSGDFSVRGIVYGLRLGVLLPFPYGYQTLPQSNPLAIKSSMLVGSTGFSGEYEYAFGESKAGIRLSVGELYLGSFTQKVPAGATAYSLHSSGQIYYAHKVLWGNDSFTFTGGIGSHQVTKNEADQTAGRVSVIEKSNFTSPVLRVDYARLGERLFGGTVQYYSAILYLTGWVEVVKNFLFVDVKYYTPVSRDPHPWEQKYFFMISPRIQITY